MNESLVSILVGTAGLGVAALLALLLTVTRSMGDPSPTAQQRLVRLAALAIVLQGFHFLEEWVTGFYERFPALLGLLPWPRSFFVWFNVFWMVLWVAALIGLSYRVKAALLLFPLWFLGIAGVANGIAHPLFSVIERGYFPGLWTSPAVGIVGAVLLHKLVSFTQTEPIP